MDEELDTTLQDDGLGFPDQVPEAYDPAPEAPPAFTQDETFRDQPEYQPPRRETGQGTHGALTQWGSPEDDGEEEAPAASSAAGYRDDVQPPSAPPKAPPGYTTHTTTVRNGPYESRQHYLVDAEGKVKGSFQEGALPQEQVPVTNGHGQVTGYRQQDVPASVNKPYADPEAQFQVKELEKQYDAVKQDQTLGGQNEPERQRILKGVQGKIDALDPNKWFRKGGLLSQQTPAAKRWHDNVIERPDGLTVAWDDQGKPHVLEKRIDKEELQDRREDRKHRLQIADRNLELANIKNKIATETHIRDKEAFEERKLAEELRKEESHLFGHEDKIDPLTGTFAWKGARTPHDARHEASLESVRRRRAAAKAGKLKQPEPPLVPGAAGRVMEARKLRAAKPTGDPVMDFNLRRMGILP